MVRELRKSANLFWLCWVLVVACGLFIVACIWDLGPRPEIEPGPPVLGTWSLTHWTTREVPINAF